MRTTTRTRRYDGDKVHTAAVERAELLEAAKRLGVLFSPSTKDHGLRVEILKKLDPQSGVDDRDEDAVKHVVAYLLGKQVRTDGGRVAAARASYLEHQGNAWRGADAADEAAAIRRRVDSSATGKDRVAAARASYLEHQGNAWKGDNR